MDAKERPPTSSYEAHASRIFMACASLRASPELTADVHVRRPRIAVVRPRLSPEAQVVPRSRGNRYLSRAVHRARALPSTKEAWLRRPTRPHARARTPRVFDALAKAGSSVKLRLPPAAASVPRRSVRQLAVGLANPGATTPFAVSQHVEYRVRIPRRGSRRGSGKIRIRLARRGRVDGGVHPGCVTAVREAESPISRKRCGRGIERAVDGPVVDDDDRVRETASGRRKCRPAVARAWFSRGGHDARRRR